MRTVELPHPRTAHAGGQTEIAYDAARKCAVTGGSDGQLLAFATAPAERLDDATPVSTGQSGAICSLAACQAFVAVAAEDNTVTLLDADTLKVGKQAVRSATLQVAVAFSPDGSRLLAGGADGMVRSVDMADLSSVKSISVNAGIRSLAVDPRGEFVACTTMAGALVLLRIDPTTNELAIAHETPNLTHRGAAGTPRQSRPAWHPSGAILAVPSGNDAIALVSRGSGWRITEKLVGGHRDPVTAVSYSPSGAVLASIGLDGAVALWDGRPGDRPERLLATMAVSGSGRRMTSLAWTASGSDLLLVDSAGLFYHVADVLGDKDMSDDDSVLVEQSTETHVAIKDDEEFVVDDDGAGYAEPDSDRRAKAPEKRPASAPNSRSRFNDVVEKWSKRTRAGGHDAASVSGGSSASDGDDEGFAIQRTTSKTLHAGETPPDASGRRILTFNMAGVVTAVPVDGERTTVQVELHDEETHRPMQLSDLHGFSMAHVDERGVVLGSRGRAGAASVLLYRPFASWASSGQWQVTLGDDEEVACVCATSRGIVAATSRQYLRLFSFAGVQTFVQSVSGPIVALSSARGLLLVVTSAPGGGLEYTLYAANTMGVVREGRVPVSPGASLVWVQFAADSGIPCTMDSAGVVRGLALYCDGAWVPLLETRTAVVAAHESLWPVGVMEQQLVCVRLRGGARNPPAFPKPALDQVPLRLPLLDAGGPRGAAEEALVRQSLFFGHRVGSAADGRGPPVGPADRRAHAVAKDKQLIKLFQLACQADDNQRALDLATYLQTLPALEGAVQLAQAKRLTRLAERVFALKQRREARRSGGSPDRSSPPKRRHILGSGPGQGENQL